MRLLELVFREINVVLVHSGIMVPAISLDRVRQVRPSANLQVNQAGGVLAVVYPEERMAVQFDPQRITVTDNSSRPPEQCPLIEVAHAHLSGIGSPQPVAFGYNFRFDFGPEGVETPPGALVQKLLRDPSAVANALRTEGFEPAFGFIYRRGVKQWTYRLDPVPGAPNRLLVHANVHEDLMQRPAALTLSDTSGSESPDPPSWLQAADQPALPPVESMKADIASQCVAALDTTVWLMDLANGS